jgi:hypothetical protein
MPSRKNRGPPWTFDHCRFPSLFTDGIAVFSENGALELPSGLRKWDHDSIRENMTDPSPTLRGGTSQAAPPDVSTTRRRVPLDELREDTAPQDGSQ